MFFHKIDYQAQHFLQQNTICKGRHVYVCIGIPENHMSEALKYPHQNFLKTFPKTLFFNWKFIQLRTISH